ncbi:hypothetical protein KBC99_00800 [Candidatus Saccharibacteria bacterium]|nr:hypothetical protein [Candidatus Saccharibacteria bacterium]
MDRAFPQSPPPEKNESGAMPPAGTGAGSEAGAGSVAQPLNPPSHLQSQPSEAVPQPQPQLQPQPQYPPKSQPAPQTPQPTTPAGAQPANGHYTVTPVFPSYAQPSQLATSQLRQNLNPQAHALPAAPRSKSRLKLALIAGFALISLSVAGIYGFKMYSDYTYNQFVTDYEKASWAYMQEWTRGVKAISHITATERPEKGNILAYRDELRSIDSSFTSDQATKLKAWQSVVVNIKKQTLWLNNDQRKFITQSDSALSELLSATNAFSEKAELSTTITSAILQFVDDAYKLQDLGRSGGINGVKDIDFLEKYASTEPYYENSELLKKDIPSGAQLLSNLQALYGRIYIGYKKILQNDMSGLDDLRKIDFDSIFSEDQIEQADIETKKIFTADIYNKLKAPIQNLRTEALAVTKERSKLGVSRYEAQAIYYSIYAVHAIDKKSFPRFDSFAKMLPSIKEQLNFEISEPSNFIYSSDDGEAFNLSYKEDTTGRQQVVAEAIEAQEGGTKLEAVQQDIISAQLEQSARILPRLSLPDLIKL